MTENLINRLLPHQGCVIVPMDGGIEVAGSAMTWVMSAAVAPIACHAPFAFRVVGRTDSTNLRLHWHRGEVILNWEVSPHELRVHDPATAEQHSIKGKGFIRPGEWHEIVWEIHLDRMQVQVNGEIRFESAGNYTGIVSTPSVGPCYGSTIGVREFTLAPLA